jgi:hypothetical protein
MPVVRRSGSLQLTTRDLDILRWIGQGGVASLDQVARRFWEGKQPETALTRLRQLVKGGYLEAHVCDALRPGELVFTLTQRGRLEFDPSWRERLQIGLPSAGEIRQQLLAQDAYLALEAWAREQGAELVSWSSEREMRASFHRTRRSSIRRSRQVTAHDIADAQAVVLTADGERLLLDIEIDGAYYGKMLKDKAARLGKSGRTVIWVCTQEREASIRRATNDYPNILVLVA